MNTGRFSACGDWMLHMHADFTAGDGIATAGNGGLWIDQSGAPSVQIFHLFLRIWKRLALRKTQLN